MDKIPAALQHKIDYIKALDIPVEQKSRRIGREVLDYWANYWSSSRGDYNLSIEDLLPLIAAAKEAKAKGKGSWSMDEYEAIKKESNLHVSGIAPERMITGKALKEIMVDIVNEKAVMINKVNLGYSVDMSGPPPPPMPPKRVICEDVKSPMSKANALILQQLQVGFASIRNIPDPSTPIVNNVRNKPDQHEHNLSRFLWAGAFSLCAAIGFVIGVAFGGSL